LAIQSVEKQDTELADQIESRLREAITGMVVA